MRQVRSLFFKKKKSKIGLRVVGLICILLYVLSFCWMPEPTLMVQQIMAETAKWRHHYRWLLPQVMVLKSLHHDTLFSHVALCCAHAQYIAIDDFPSF